MKKKSSPKSGRVPSLKCKNVSGMIHQPFSTQSGGALDYSLVHPIKNLLNAGCKHSIVAKCRRGFCKNGPAKKVRLPGIKSRGFFQVGILILTTETDPKKTSPARTTLGSQVLAYSRVHVCEFEVPPYRTCSAHQRNRK